jgi:hypothetical protein
MYFQYGASTKTSLPPAASPPRPARWAIIVSNLNQNWPIHPADTVIWSLHGQPLQAAPQILLQMPGKHCHIAYSHHHSHCCRSLALHRCHQMQL